MQTLVQDLLSFSKISRGELIVKTVNVQEIAELVTSTLDTVITECQATITIGTLPSIKVNPTQIEQLLLNLIGNSLKYRGTQHPVIDISATRNQEYWEFAIRDNGIGLDPIYAKQIFVIFQRLHTKQEFAGTGIGLAICQKIVEHHGGEIWVKSTPGEGSTFFFTIPHTPHREQRFQIQPQTRQKKTLIQ